jgi:hypothetical protein
MQPSQLSTAVAPFIEVPTFDHQTQQWDKTIFYTRDEFREYAKTLFKEPGKYDLDESTLKFNEQARLFNERGYYCDAPFRSKDFIAYWDREKEKCTMGVIIRNGDKEWYLTRQYYMWVNFLPILDKETTTTRFPDIYDVQYHMALYELLAELHYKHAVILKKRQIASSFFHAGRLINRFWFDEGAVLKIGAELKNYVNSEKGTWGFLNTYRDFLNEHTAWYRPCDPDKDMAWQQRIKVTVNGRDHYKGNKCKMTATSFEKNPTAGVGGPCKEFFHEEAGIAPKMNITYRYMKPALRLGAITTGLFIAAGSVGELDHCKPLKEFMEKPMENDFYAVETNLIDDKGTIGMSGLFIPEQWCMKPYIDQYGNSDVQGALDWLEKEFSKMKRELSPEDYQLEVSQRPRNIAEAFAARKESKFPTHLVTPMQRRIKDKEFPMEYLDIDRDITGKIEVKPSTRIPIQEWPIRSNSIDKRSVLVVHERPIANAPWGTYYGSIDPVSEGKTTTSDSLCSIYIYKNPVEVTTINDGIPTTHIERDKLVAWWCGRYDDIKKTHEMLELIIEWYNAWTIVENNVSLFIQYMISRRKQKYLVPKDQVLFLKDLGSNSTVYAEYGWKNTGTLFRNHLLSYLIEWIKEVIDETFDENGKTIALVHGIERIPDLMALVEMMGYDDKANVDRLVSLAALVAFAKVQQANRGLQKRVVEEGKKLENSKNLYNLRVGPFRHLGGSSTGSTTQRINRNPYRHIR